MGKTNRFEQRQFHYTNKGIRGKAIGVIITVPEKDKKLLDKIDVVFVDESFQDNKI